MRIFLILLAILAAIIALFLMLPVDIIIKSGKENELILRFKFLFKLYGGDEKTPKSNPIVSALKKTTGIEKLEIKTIKKNLKEKSYAPTVSETLDILKGLLKEIGSLLRHFRAKVFSIDVKCAATDAADAAINYGQYCALIYPLTAALSSFVKIPKRAISIDIALDHSIQKDNISYNIVLSVRVFRILSAFLKVVFKEAMRTLEEKKD